MAEDIPEDVVVHILERLPTNTLIRFTCVSKRWRSIILYDHQFAKSHFQIASETTPTRLLFAPSSSDSEYEFLDTDTPLTSCSVRKLACPREFKQRDHVVRILSSCNGLLLASSINKDDIASKLYIWNPSTGFFKNCLLPKSFSVHTTLVLGMYRPLMTTKLLSKSRTTMSILTWFLQRPRYDAWKTIQIPSNVPPLDGQGFLFNEVLHWIYRNHYTHTVDLIIAFDSGKEGFRQIHLPTNINHPIKLFSFRGCLCVADYAHTDTASLELWLMREHEMADSWTKLYNIKVSLPFRILIPILVTETSTLMQFYMPRYREMKLNLIRSSVHDQGEEFDIYSGNNLPAKWDVNHLIVFKESLLWLR